MKTKHIIYCIFGVLMFAACSGIDYEQQLERFEEMNRTDVPMTPDSVQPLVRHYDHWWHSRNHRMRAYYMLGCAYRDQGSAPRALENYQRAASIADTTDADCDLNVLMRVHSQMAQIFLLQRLPELEERENIIAKRLCWQIGDTLSALIFEEQECNLLYNKEKYEECISKALELHQKFLDYGYKDDAPIVYIYCIRAYLMMGDYANAKKYLNLYETCPYFKTDPSKIAGGVGAIYNYKGQYYVGVRELDSAEYYFQKAKPYNNKLLPYKGLIQTYELKHETDSIVKYVRLYSDAKEQSFDETRAEALTQAKAMYDYSVEKELAQRKAQTVRRLILGLVATILFTLLITLYYLYRNEKRKREFSELRRDLETSLNNLREAEEALEALKQEKDADLKLVESLQRDIADHKQHIANLEAALPKSAQHNADAELAKSDIVKRFREARNGGASITPLTEEDWTKMADSIEEIYPQFHHVVNARGPLQTKEYRLCLLTKAQFSPSDIDVLMGQKPSYSTTIAKRLCQKVFGFDGSAADFRHNISLI